MTSLDLNNIFTKEKLEDLFPPDKTDDFFEALYGDASEGSYDISLEFNKLKDNHLLFEFHLKKRPGKCLVCSRTHGLPVVFARHPIVDIQGLSEKISELLGDKGCCTGWKIDNTREISRRLHVVPVTFQLN